MKIVNNDILNESNHVKSCSPDYIDTEEIFRNVTFLQETYGHLSSFHSIYLQIIQDIQVNLIERLQHKQFDDPYFIASTTAHFVCAIMDDLKHPCYSQINRLITKFQLQNPQYKEQIISSKLGMKVFYDFLVNQMSHFEDSLRANAMIKSGKTCFTSHDKNQIIDALTSVIYQHLQHTSFPKNTIRVYIEKLSEKLIKSIIRYICLKHINKSIVIANFQIQH